MAKNNNLTDFLTDVADAIREKKYTTALINPQDFASEIKSIETDIRPSGYFKVTFIDIDGTTLKTQYVLSGGSATPPANPIREYCTFQKWIGKYTNVTHDSFVGPQYESSDGKTRMRIKVGKHCIYKFSLTHSGTTECSVDWGDGTVEIVNSSSSAQILSHTYNADFEGWIALAIDKSDTFPLDFNVKYCLLDYIEGRKITSLNSYVFRYCRALHSIVLPDSVTSIGSHAFDSCYVLNSIVIPDSVTSIKDGAFYGCRSLNSIVIPDSVTSIKYDAFYGCASLQSIVIPNSVTSIEYNAFYGCASLHSIVLSNSVTSIEGDVFDSCYALQSIVIPDSVTSIKHDAFYRCYSLNSIVIPDSVTSIEGNVFDSCYALQSIVIPNSVTSIVGTAFHYCYNLFIISCLATIPPTLSPAFSLSSLIAIYVPDGSVEAYKAATNWADIANKILPISQY